MINYKKNVKKNMRYKKKNTTVAFNELESTKKRYPCELALPVLIVDLLGTTTSSVYLLFEFNLLWSSRLR